ncbi:Jumonji AT rich interactive domain 2 [Carabus blaptoides fortunei]
MVVSRNDIKRKRKDSDTTVDTLPDSPKRTKVHAQRKFAQGSNVGSPVITPVKELDREKVKCTDILQTTTELLPIKRPNTEDFLTFLCFRGTPILPPSLNFFNTANSITTQNVSTTSSETLKNPPPSTCTNVVQQDSVERPFIAFGVRKRADPFINNKLEKKRRHALALQTLRRKFQEQRMAKIRAVSIEKMSYYNKKSRQTRTIIDIICR